MDNAEIDRRFEVLRKILCNLKYSVNLMPFKEVFDQAKTSEVVFVDHGEPNGDMTCEIKGYYKDDKFFITGAKLTEPIDDIQVAEITKQEEEEELRRRFMAQPKTDLEADLRQYQKPTDEAVRLCSTCIGCECEPELGETVKNCKCYIKREPTDAKILAALSWFEDMGNHEIAHRIKQQPDYISTMPDTVIETIVTALRQMRSEQPCEICANFKRIECKADNLEFIAVRCPNCGRLVG